MDLEMKNNGGKVLLYIQWFRSLLSISLYYLRISEYQRGPCLNLSPVARTIKYIRIFLKDDQFSELVNIKFKRQKKKKVVKVNFLPHMPQAMQLPFLGTVIC